MIKVKRSQDVQAMQSYMNDCKHYAHELHTTELFNSCDPSSFDIWAGLMDLSMAIYACNYTDLPLKMESIFLNLSEIEYNKTIHEDRLCIRNIINMLYNFNDFLQALPKE